MKKFIFLLSAMLFTVVMFASPPPTETFYPDQLAFVQDISTDVPVEYDFNSVVVAPEVAYIYVGNRSVDAAIFIMFDDPGYMEIQEAAALNLCTFYTGEDLNKSPSDELQNGAKQNTNSGFNRNLQHSNFGYPLTADNI